MTREHKLALVVGFGLVLFVGILIADHLAAGRRGHDGLEAMVIQTTEYTLLTAEEDAALVRESRPSRQTRETPRAEDPRPVNPVVDFAANAPVRARPAATPPAGLGGHPTRDRGVTRHVVRAGERLEDIADQFYGDRAGWKIIANANGIARPELLQSGQRIVIPSRKASGTPAAVRREPTRRASITPRAPRNYKVRSGDSLAKIARQELNDEGRWRDIQRLNRLPDQVIMPGQSLKLPTP